MDFLMQNYLNNPKLKITFALSIAILSQIGFCSADALADLSNCLSDSKVPDKNSCYFNVPTTTPTQPGGGTLMPDWQGTISSGSSTGMPPQSDFNSDLKILNNDDIYLPKQIE